MLRVSLQNKILLGYLLLVAVISSMTAILLHERKRMHEIEAETTEIRKIRKDINTVHRRITELATHGESVITWNEMDFRKYRDQRLGVDSLLQVMKQYVGGFVHTEQIDTLCNLLEEKENHLLHIMETVAIQRKTDSLLVNHLPEVARRATRVRIVTQKKSGIAGFFGGKKSVQVLPSAQELHAFSDSLIALQRIHTVEMETYADSLRSRNRTLNRELSQLISSLDNQAQAVFAQKDQKIAEAQDLSFFMFAIIVTFAIILLLISFLIIRSDLRKEERIKSRLNQVISENKELLEMRKRIILTVSHDIRGPLGNIHNCADLASQTREKKKRESYLEDIRHSCHHILHLVNDLMDAYRINEVGDLRNDIPFDLNRFLKRISDEFSRKAISKALILYAVHENCSLTVKGDADKLEQVLANLLTNAIKFTPSGTVNFHSRYSDGKLNIEIRDTGIGMDEETLKRIFAPFERAAQNINSEGFGLGLFLTKGLVKVLDGTMDVESELGKGSVFRLEFPLPETDEPAEEDKQDNNQIFMLPKKVLVVDDDPIQLKIAEDMLGRNGITCTTCMNIQEVVAALEKSDYDIVLTDVQMPETDGFGLLKLLRNSDIGNSRSIPVAVMTARSDGNTGIYEKEGFAGYIHKPFNIHGLLSFLSTIISHTRVSNAGDFDFSCLLKDIDDNGYMLSLVIDESRKELAEMELALKKYDRELMRKIIHRMMPVWEILGKERLLREFQKELHNNESVNEIIGEYARQVIDILEKLIKETEKELGKYENTDS